MEKGCTIGFEELDEILGIDGCRGFVVVAGHPGAGKTTFASNIAYRNATRYGRKVLFIEFIERKELLYRNMERLGILLHEAEEIGLLRFVRPPLPGGSDGLRSLLQHLSSAIAHYDPDVVVLDGFSPLLYALNPGEARSYLQTTLYEMAHSRGRLVVLSMEAGWRDEYGGLAGAEFVADIVLFLGVRLERGVASRYLEIRKCRWRPVPFARIPFVISNRGIELILPPRSEKSGGVGLAALVLYPMGTDVYRVFLRKAVEHLDREGGSALILSFTEPKQFLEEFLHREVLGASKPVHVAYINPVLTPPQELYRFVVEQHRRRNPRIVVVLGARSYADTWAVSFEDLAEIALNAITYLKSRGVSLLLMYAAIGDLPRTVEFYDVVAEVKEVEEREGVAYRAKISKGLPGDEVPRVVDAEYAADYVARTLLRGFA